MPDLHIPASDGLPLAATEVGPDDPRTAVVIVAAATAVPRAFYGPFARYLASQGMRSVTFDYRGVGDSRPASLRGFHATMRDWGEKDLAGVLASVRSRWPAAPVAMVGHSIGGVIPPLAAGSDSLRGLVTVASQGGHWRLWPFPSSLAYAALWWLAIPSMTLPFGYLPSRRFIGQDLPRGVALEWAEWSRTPDYLIGADPSLAPRFASFRVPLLAHSIDDDNYAPRPAVDWLARAYLSAPMERRHLVPDGQPIGHFGFFHLRHRELWPPVVEWLAERLQR